MTKSIIRSWVAGAAALMVCAASGWAQASDKQETYGTYARSCVAAGHKPISAAAWVRAHRSGMGLALSGTSTDGSPENPLARGPYAAERSRHDALRARAEALSRDPKMERYQSRANDLKADDDRRVQEFDRQAALAGGSMAALSGLKLHDDKLDQMVAQVEQVVRH